MSAALPPPLATTVDGIWRFQSLGAQCRILPDGCMDFVFDLNSGTAEVVGSMTRAELIAPPLGARYFGVRFLPGVAALLIDAHAGELTDASVELAPLLCAEWRTLPERVASLPDDSARVHTLERFLAAANNRRRVSDARLTFAVNELRRSAGARRVRELAREVGVSERQLERLFDERVGVRPKLFARVMRMQHAVTLLRKRALPTQAALAIEAGYSDEPHLLRDFRELTAVTPREAAAEPHVGIVQDARA
ncbi:MAG TPA: helix-turn-helix transcriptional regulator [Polyangiaceae bacterium]|nr:helix-turn-helix transcriptional regulator [Polyangiaceae bacterium]